MAIKKLKLKVIFDTNVVYTGSASDLLRNEIVELINNHKSLSDIEIEWLLPETVIKERIFQMNKRGIELLPAIQKLEKLLGHNLNITKEIIQERILETVRKQLISYEIKTLKIDTNKVDWENIINNSLNRLVPFEDNEKEKGFRDALILECLKQTIESSPITKSICRIIFITNDNILNEAAAQIGSQSTNVNVFPNIDEFVSLINILDSEITEELINKIINDSDKLFFEKDNTSTLFYSQNLRNKISEDYKDELNDKMEGANSREYGIWRIGKPGFEKKKRQKVIWKTIISIDFVDYKNTWAIMPNRTSLENYYSIDRYNMGIMDIRAIGNNTIGIGNLRNGPMGIGLGSAITGNLQNYNSGIYDREQTTPIKEKIGEGKTRFEITWSLTLTTENKIKNPKIESIKYLDIVYS